MRTRSGTSGCSRRSRRAGRSTGRREGRRDRRDADAPPADPADGAADGLAARLRGGVYDSRRRGEPLVPGRYYDLTFDLEPDDQVIPAGKQLGIMIMSSDPEFTLWPRAGTRL